MAAPLAEPGQRLLARVVDTLVVGVPVILVVRAFVSGPTVDAVAPPALAGCMLVYEAVQLALWGRTLGKRVAGIEVVAATPQEADQGPPGGAGDAEPGPAPLIPASVPGFVPTAASSGGEGPAEGGGVPSGKSVPARRAPGRSACRCPCRGLFAADRAAPDSRSRSAREHLLGRERGDAVRRHAPPGRP
ncbi:RDD family protein [Actinomadura madurae]|uniref:RDD family protein n=1 Tax=Actinomadura madurae TaxID=1993 RepID=UPI0020D1F60B|nr:RDD family protein [Actinomadura madurae]MCP9969549.1 RDD family protein [Actinomadura madurae]